MSTGRDERTRPGAGQAADAQVGLAGRRRAGRRRAVAHVARRDPAEAELGIDDVEHRQRHRLQLGVDLGAGAEQAGEAGAAAGEAELGRREPPALRRAVSSAGVDQLERAPVERARCRSPGSGPARCRRRALNEKSRPREPAIRARTWPTPPRKLACASRLAIDSGPRLTPRATIRPSIEVPAGSSRTTPSIVPRRITIGGGPAKWASLAVRSTPIRWWPPNGLNSSRPSSPPPATSSRPVKPPGSERSAAAGARPRDVQRRDLDDRRLARAAAGSRRCR